jgi:hypothetical protein
MAAGDRANESVIQKLPDSFGTAAAPQGKTGRKNFFTTVALGRPDSKPPLPRHDNRVAGRQ